MTSRRSLTPVPRRRRFLAGMTALAFTPLMTSCGGGDDAGDPGVPSGPTVPPAPGVAGPAWWGFLTAGTMRIRSPACGANTPWKRVRLTRGKGTKEARRAKKSSGSRITCVVPSRYGVFNAYRM